MKKTISLILCAALFCSIFAACSNADTSNKTDESVEADNVQIKITTDAHYASLDESSIKAYEKLCNAVLNYESEVKYNVSLTDDVNRRSRSTFLLTELIFLMIIPVLKLLMQTIRKLKLPNLKNLIMKFQKL